jgi:hypothetical protein
MNTGSNPVGVAASDDNGKTVKQDVVEQQPQVTPTQKSSGLAHDWPKAGGTVEVRKGKGWEVRKVVGLRGKSLLVEGREGAMRASSLGTLWRWPVEAVREEGRGACLCQAGLCFEGAVSVEEKPEGKPEGFTGCPPVPGQEVEIFEGRYTAEHVGKDLWRQARVVAWGERGMTYDAGEGSRLCNTREGEDWRWPVKEKPIRDSEPSGVCPGCGRASATYDKESGLCWTCEGDRRGIERAREDVAGEAAMAMVLDAGIGAMRGHLAPAFVPGATDDLRVTHGKNGVPALPAVPDPVPGPRTCKGVPIYQTGQEACDTILGREVEGDRCTVCAEWMRVHGECDGCCGRLPGWKVTGKLCADCRAVRQAAIREEAEQPNDKRRPLDVVLDEAYREFYEALWERIAEESDLDPRTVAVCKLVRDDERAVRGRRP